MEWVTDGDQISTGPSNLTVDPLSEDGPVRIGYDWIHESKVHRGEMLVSADGKGGAVIGWVDAWHQSADTMRLVGQEDSNAIKVFGKYQVEGYPEWGWRIEWESNDGALHMRMFNVSPEGDESWAVRAEYRRG